VTTNPLTDLLIDIARAGMNQPAPGRPYTTAGGQQITIKTSFDYPPIPIRSMDWSAYDASTYCGCEECNYPVGRGATEEEAVRDLIELIEDREEG